MWFKTIFRRSDGQKQPQADALFDENFLRRLERLSLQAQRSLRGYPARGEHPSRHHLPSSIFSDHRPYSGGDELRYIDWNAYSRHQHLLLKLGEAEQDVDVHLLLDVSRSMAWGKPPKLRVAQQLVGALGYLSLAHSDRVHVAPFGANIPQMFGPAQGKGRVMPMLHYIETVEVQRQTSLAQTLHQYARRYQRGGMLVLCSDLLVPEGLEEGLRPLVPPRWQVLVMHIVDRHELYPDLRGSVELYDSETGQRLPLTLDPQIADSYHQQVMEWLHNIGAICARRGASYARIQTDWPMEKSVVPYLRTRQFLA